MFTWETLRDLLQVRLVGHAHASIPPRTAPDIVCFMFVMQRAIVMPRFPSTPGPVPSAAETNGASGSFEIHRNRIEAASSVNSPGRGRKTEFIPFDTRLG